MSRRRSRGTPRGHDISCPYECREAVEIRARADMGTRLRRILRPFKGGTAARGCKFPNRSEFNEHKPLSKGRFTLNPRQPGGRLERALPERECKGNTHIANSEILLFVPFSLGFSQFLRLRPRKFPWASPYTWTAGSAVPRTGVSRRGLHLDAGLLGVRPGRLLLGTGHVGMAPRVGLLWTPGLLGLGRRSVRVARRLRPARGVLRRD